ncbi:hypothetical protein BWQ96_09306 [Gracilariopsis chorda]|uniref:Uncharacterized protein n=1 Tax=Gracilariopsis chorda TaxID=448386 RepID=A0A2V3IFW2_9FLOR|nr:hypothetical protein BWQ96_09306 [Gracilariopsis chorda]|eukprot:PXF40975.1 hypothetical protein BWQ96_09306 [Gracilariopsis chorda]
MAYWRFLSRKLVQYTGIPLSAKHLRYSPVPTHRIDIAEVVDRNESTQSTKAVSLRDDHVLRTIIWGVQVWLKYEQLGCTERDDGTGCEETLQQRIAKALAEGKNALKVDQTSIQAGGQQ